MTKHEAIAIMYGYSQDYLEHLKVEAGRDIMVQVWGKNWLQSDIKRLEQALDVMKGVDHGT